MWFEFLLLQLGDGRRLGLALRHAALFLLYGLFVAPSVVFVLFLASVPAPLIAAFRRARRALTVAATPPRALVPVLVPLLLVLLRG